MRKHYLDNIRWITVVLVVFYHVIFMYNGVVTAMVIGPFHENQFQDRILYMLYPWFMVILFIVSGMSARYYFEKHTIKEFIKDRTRRLLVPATIGLFVFQWIQGYYSMSISNAFETIPEEIPGFVLYLIMALSGQGVLWYIQLLWILSMGLALLRKFEKGKLHALCGKANVLVLVALGVAVWVSGLILNMPVIVVFRFGIYGFTFFLGYYLFSNDAVIERLSKFWHVLGGAAIVLGVLYAWLYFGKNYSEVPTVNCVLAVSYGWIAILAIFAGMKKFMDFTNPFMSRMSKKSFGLYVFHYLPLSAVAYYLDRYTQAPAVVCYVLTGVAAFAGGYLLYEMISRIPVVRWCVLGIKKQTKAKKQ